MTTSATTEAKNVLTQDEIFALASRAHGDPGALDEMASAFAVQADSARRSARRADFLEREVARLEHRIETLLRRLFGRSSEKIDPAQLALFLGEAAAAGAVPEPPAPEAAPVRAARPKGHGRAAFAPHIPRRRIELEPPETDRTCACGRERGRIGEDVTERGRFVPGYWEVNSYVRGVWACPKGCGVVMADLPPALVEKAKFEPCVAVHAAVDKYGDHLPLHRQEERHARMGVSAPATTVGDELRRLHELHVPTVEQASKEVFASPVVHSDDTPFTTLVERAPDAPKTDPKKSAIEGRVWIYLTRDGKTVYRFTAGRGGAFPTIELADFAGVLVVDGYAGYDETCRRKGVRRAGCLVHARRKFKDAFVADRERSARALHLIGRVFRIERAARGRAARDPSFGLAGLLALRRRRSKPAMEKFKSFCETVRDKVLPKSPIGEAASYALNQWPTFETFLDDPAVPPDNSAAERGIRCLALGRNNHLFFGSPDGGAMAATFYSLIGSCKAIGVDPAAYLLDVTDRLLRAPDTPRERVTPWAWAKERGMTLAADLFAPPADIRPA